MDCPLLNDFLIDWFFVNGHPAVTSTLTAIPEGMRHPAPVLGVMTIPEKTWAWTVAATVPTAVQASTRRSHFWDPEEARLRTSRLLWCIIIAYLQFNYACSLLTYLASWTGVSSRKAERTWLCVF